MQVNTVPYAVVRGSIPNTPPLLAAPQLMDGQSRNHFFTGYSAPAFILSDHTFSDIPSNVLPSARFVYADVACCHVGHGHCHIIGLISLPLPATPPQIKSACLVGSTGQRFHVVSSTGKQVASELTTLIASMFVSYHGLRHRRLRDSLKRPERHSLQQQFSFPSGSSVSLFCRSSNLSSRCQQRLTRSERVLSQASSHPWPDEATTT